MGLADRQRKHVSRHWFRRTAEVRERLLNAQQPDAATPEPRHVFVAERARRGPFAWVVARYTREG